MSKSHSFFRYWQMAAIFSRGTVMENSPRNSTGAEIPSRYCAFNLSMAVCGVIGSSALQLRRVLTADDDRPFHGRPQPGFALGLLHIPSCPFLRDLALDRHQPFQQC